VLLAEHRLERCLPAADRVIALDHGRLVCDAAPEGFLAWAGRAAPDLATPAAELFARAGLGPLPTSVKAARRALAHGGLVPREGSAVALARGRASATRPRLRTLSAPLRRRPAPAPAALALDGVWHELLDGPAILRGIDLRVEAGERVVLMGRNGAGKSTLLRHAAGLLEPTRGQVERTGRVALLLQGAGDHLLAERAGDEVDAPGLARAGLTAEADADPRDLSGGERQRLALEVVLAGPVPAAVCLDEPTRGMDRAHGRRLSERVGTLADEGAAVLVATHDAEFAAGWAERVVLMGRGTVIADGPAAEVLTGGSYFATEVARALGGADGALTPEQGAQVLERELGAKEVMR
jgi:energy-coupling factor transport system ATP-binding protein